MKLLSTLKPHQETGLQWLIQNQTRGCILADEMGLGKTVQICGLLSTDICKTIIIVPLQLLYQWQSEIYTHIDIQSDDVYIFYGKNKKTDDKIYKSKIIITNYECIISEYKIDHFQFLKNLNIDRIVCDEGHRLKNIKSKLYHCMKTMVSLLNEKCNLKIILLTGTPIINNINDVISLITLLHNRDYSLISYWKKRFNAKIELLTAILPEVLLSRNKSILHDLPKIHTHAIHLKLIDYEDRLYNDIHKSTLDPDQLHENINIEKIHHHLAKIIRLRQCADTYKIISRNDDITIKDSVKINKILDILKNNNKTSKYIIYSTFTTFLEILKKCIKEPSLLYTGKVNIKDRQDIIDTFNNSDSDIRILLISIGCGSVGLNLTTANNVILCEPQWNNSIERQAMDRVYRIGQKRDVNVYTLHIESSIENWIHDIKVEKKCHTDIVQKGCIDIEDITMSKLCRDVSKKMYI